MLSSELKECSGVLHGSIGKEKYREEEKARHVFRHMNTSSMMGRDESPKSGSVTPGSPRNGPWLDTCPSHPVSDRNYHYCTNVSSKAILYTIVKLFDMALVSVFFLCFMLGGELIPLDDITYI